jgi:hypothetical protein
MGEDVDEAVDLFLSVAVILLDVCIARWWQVVAVVHFTMLAMMPGWISLGVVIVVSLFLLTQSSNWRVAVVLFLLAHWWMFELSQVH